MSKQISNEVLARDIERVRRECPLKYTLPVQFPVVDAALFSYTAVRFGHPDYKSKMQLVRSEVTTGSVHYVLCGGHPDPQHEPIKMAFIEVRQAMENTTYLSMVPLDDDPFFDAEQDKVRIDAFCRAILFDFLRWFIADQEHIVGHKLDSELGGDIAEPKPDATVREHALWHHLKLEPKGIDIKEYARQIVVNQQSLYNERKKLGITTPRGGKKRSKSK